MIFLLTQTAQVTIHVDLSAFLGAWICIVLWALLFRIALDPEHREVLSPALRGFCLAFGVLCAVAGAGNFFRFIVQLFP